MNGNFLYKGDFIKGKYEGNGKYILENDENYKGQYKNSLRNKKRIEYNKNRNIKVISIKIKKKKMENIFLKMINIMYLKKI